MLAGAFGKFPETTNIADKITNHSYEHDLEGETVSAVIQLDNLEVTINRKKILKGIAIDHRMLPDSKLVKDDRGKFRIETEIKPQPVYTRFEIIGNNLVRVQNSSARSVAFSVLSHGLGGVVDYVKPVNFDLQTLARDYSGHWVGGIQDRDGHMQSGIFWGDTIERDDAIGRCYRNGTKNQVGFATEYFGNEPMKVRVTKEGSIQVYGNVTEEQYIQFVMDELSQYMIDAPRSRRRHTS